MKGKGTYIMAKEREEIKFEIVEHIADLQEGSRGWMTELNIVAWGTNAPKFDLRSWNEDHTKCGKGITLGMDAMYALAEFFDSDWESIIDKAKEYGVK